MALMKCKECGGQVSGKAKVCPHCGQNLEPSKLLFFIAILLVFGLIGKCTNVFEPLKTNKQSVSILDQYVDLKVAYAPGSYAKGELTKGTYIFLTEKNGYFEEEMNGEIITNAILPSFGYVYIAGQGNIKAQGYLIKIEDFKKTNFESLKNFYEIVTNQENYNFSGYYKVGVDIMPGKYKITSVGEGGYISINDGPIGNSSILDNDNFNGSKIISLRSGQYLELSRIKFEKIN